MKTRLVFVLVLFMLCGCVTYQPRPSGSLADGTFHLEIGKPLPNSLQNCPTQ